MRIASLASPGAALLALALAAAALPSRADAQLLGRIKRAAQSAATDAAGNKLGATAAEKAGVTTPAAGSSGAPARPVLVVTTENIDLLIAAFEPTLTAQQRHQAVLRAAEAHGAFVACRAEAQQKMYANPTESPAGAAEAKRMNAKADDLADRVGKLNPMQDQARVIALADSADMYRYRAQRASYPALFGKCGEFSWPNRDPAAQASASFQAPAPAVPPGMSSTQFGRLRERIALWALGKPTGFTDDELSALESRRPQLSPLAEAFRGGALVWSSWSDLTYTP